MASLYHRIQELAAQKPDLPVEELPEHLTAEEGEAPHILNIMRIFQGQLVREVAKTLKTVKKGQEKRRDVLPAQRPPRSHDDTILG